jgi:nitrite reductase/ring-hydroxylating ferredoxin subunit
MHEDFIAFRDSDGKVGIVEPRCSHRGANLFFGRNEQCGLRCAYHGWKYATDGSCIDIPTASSDLAEKIKPKAAIRALKVQEYGDIIWAHFGKGDSAVPKFEFAELPADQRFVSKKFQQCNWAQATEGGLDTAHFSYLHANIDGAEKAPLLPSKGTNESPYTARYRWLIEDGSPRFDVLKHASGLLLGAARNADNDQLYWRVTQFLMPNHSLAPNSFPGDMNQGNTWVPVDDHSCWIFCFAYHVDRPLTHEERERLAAGSGIFAEVDENYLPIRNRDNDYLIDREVQKRSNFTGITGISEQDAAIADSQGLIADRTNELLGQTDLGVVRFRQMMLNAADQVRAGELPHGANSPDAYLVRSGDMMSDCGADLGQLVKERFGDLAGVTLGPSQDRA